MTFFTFSPCNFTSANGEQLYHNIQLTLDSSLSALIGRNGAGKSLLAGQLAKQHQQLSYLLSQLPPNGWQQRSIASLLVLEHILT
ncbi:hypothetical protein, partial [Rheinheimera sp.]|uniref:hypothetical protein n=1 Tax=Rheinheimera sp. TaxID=1869214 RepID=UPI0037C567E3